MKLTWIRLVAATISISRVNAAVPQCGWQTWDPVTNPNGTSCASGCCNSEGFCGTHDSCEIVQCFEDSLTIPYFDTESLFLSPQTVKMDVSLIMALATCPSAGLKILLIITRQYVLRTIAARERGEFEIK
jgi:hypothetical protein